MIDEHHKPAMIAAGRWVAENPGAKIRGYHINALYYQIGLGPAGPTSSKCGWMPNMTLHASRPSSTTASPKPGEDPAMRAVKHNIIADRAERYPLRTAPAGVLAITAGVDTQDNRLAVQIVGWGRGLSFWVLDYIELPGDPADDAVWQALSELLNRGVQHESGLTLDVQATCIDAGGHRTEAVKAFVRDRRIRRPLAIFGAVPNNAPVLSKGKMQDIDWKGRYDKRGVLIQHVGTVGINTRSMPGYPPTPTRRRTRLGHFSDELPPEYFAGLVSRKLQPQQNRFEKKRGALANRSTPSSMPTPPPTTRSCGCTAPPKADWDRLEARLEKTGKPEAAPVAQPKTEPSPLRQAPQKPARASGSQKDGSDDRSRNDILIRFPGGPARCRRQLYGRGGHHRRAADAPAVRRRAPLHPRAPKRGKALALGSAIRSGANIKEAMRKVGVSRSYGFKLAVVKLK